MQKQALELTRLQTPLCMEQLLPHQVNRLCSHVEHLDMQLTELSTQVQADDQARSLLRRLSGAVVVMLLAPSSPRPPSCMAPTPA